MMTDLELRGIASLLGKLVREAKEELRAEFQAQLAALPKPEKGERGERGPAGESITVIGPAGKDGKDGIDGKNGENGKDGIDGKPGKDGERGMDGKDGRDGRDGSSGKDGRDGIDGKDATEIRILDSIDCEKPVPRGTWGKHRGGLWRHTGAAWEVVIDGPADFRWNQHEDLRTFSFECETASGGKYLKEFRMPVMIYREIWTDGTEYRRGDVVTFGGSAFHCQAESTKAKPGTSSDWRLMVKEGRPGKDAKPEEPPKDKGPIRLK